MAFLRPVILAEYLMPTLSSTTEENPQLVFPTSSDGPYSIFNKQWERVFQKKPTDPSDTVVGPDERDRDLVQMRVQQLLRIITDESPQEFFPRVPVVGVASSSKTYDDGSRTDEGEGDTDGGDDGDDDDEENGSKRKKAVPNKVSKKAKTDSTSKPKPKPRAKTGSTAASNPKPNAQPKPRSSSEDSSSESSDEDTAESRASVKLTWALSQYEAPKTASKGGIAPGGLIVVIARNFVPVPAPRASTTGPTRPKESPPPVISSSMRRTVRNVLPRMEWEEYQVTRERARQELPALPAGSDASPFEAAQGMANFVQRGIEKPAKVVTNRSYRQHLVEAIEEDWQDEDEDDPDSLQCPRNAPPGRRRRETLYPG
ncbi:hypothetical protein B0H16DRAFT_1455078 [Mycena metata]|uniref:Uncharacterized protein n=1 Tax=Mycena metata TaxID=1033252 RepID=A0AAD7NJT3_9AGAR|nr:hypothetical protein B0H16DRAFT_1455078 [Mycena metata]